MKSSTYSLSTVLAISMFCSLVAAQQVAATPSTATVPRLVNFSGKAVDGQGKAISGIAGVTLAIYKEQYEGAPLWLETQNVQADTKGNYTVQLGATKSDGLPLDLFSSGEARWLGVTVNGASEQPRVLLLSVPYALKAADAETVGGLPASAFVLANKGQTGLTSAKTAAGSAAAGKSAAPSANPAVTGKGVLDFIPMWDTTSDIVDSLIFQKNSQIGINTTAPAATLDVNGKGDVRDTLTLFPKGTDSTLAVNGTNFKVDQTGKVTFISSQTFPGAGTVTSVGLSAPTTDFTVTGSPVTKSGTLNLKWNVAPTNASTANAIVKRDGTGSFNAGAITASLGVTGLSSGNAAVTGTNSSSGYGVYATSATGTAIYGQSSGTNANSHGVYGVTNVVNAYGVAGVNNATGGVGVAGVNYATGGIGVLGSGTGYGFYTTNNVYQDPGAGGWVKAMIFTDGAGNIPWCFNSTLIGPSAVTPPCGFTISGFLGDYIIDFGFGVSGRFFSATSGGMYANGTLNVCTILTSTQCGSSPTQNQVEVTNICNSGYSFCTNPFYLVVF